MWQWDQKKASPVYVLFSGANCQKKIGSYTQNRSNCTGMGQSFEWSYAQCSPTDIHGFVNAFYPAGTAPSVTNNAANAYMYTVSIQNNFGKCVTNSTSGTSVTMGCNGYNGYSISIWQENPLSAIHVGCQGTPIHTQSNSFPAPAPNSNQKNGDIIKSLCI